MAQKFCTTCGAVLPEGKNFCEQCGSPVLPDPVGADLQPAASSAARSVTPPALPAEQEKRPAGRIIMIAAVVLIVLAAGAVILVLPSLPGTGILHGQNPAPGTTLPTQVPVTTASLPIPATTPVSPAATYDPFPGALHLKDTFAFGSGSVASEASVYRIWINDTYEWHNDKDNHYYVQNPSPGNKFLFVFVDLQNIGDTRVWFPPASSARVWYHGVTYSQDSNHYKPDKVADQKATPIEVKEVMYFPDLNGDEYAQDYGFSHGNELGYLYPGASNAIDGYIIYQVPQSLTPEETYVTIPFNGKDTGIWRLG